jgi:hypothetical protein
MLKFSLYSLSYAHRTSILVEISPCRTLNTIEIPILVHTPIAIEILISVEPLSLLNYLFSLASSVKRPPMSCLSVSG